MRTAPVLCLLALLAGGCGGAPRDSATEFGGEEHRVAAAVEALERAARDDEPRRVCAELLSPSLLATLKSQGTRCATAVKDAFADAESFDLTVEDVTIAGDKATAKVRSGMGSDEKDDSLELERDGRAWKISSLRA